MNEPAAPAEITYESFLKILLFACFLVSAWFSLHYLSQPIVEAHSFRQTQTALTSYYLVRNGFSFAYWTPVVGQGWSIPFEFPVYQEIVALASRLFGTPLTNTGRVVSYLFTLLCCIPVYATLARLKIDSKARDFALALFLSSPLYLFWGSTFMIESTALFLTLCFCYYATKIMLEEARWHDYVLASVFLSLAALQKATTGLPPAMVFMAVLGIASLRRHGFRGSLLPVSKAAVTTLIPVILVLLWTHYTDQVKLQNPIGHLLTTEELEGWNYGSLSQRLSHALWSDTLWSRLFEENAGGIVGAAALLACLLLPIGRQVRGIIAVLLAATLLPFLLFTNLHIAHTYYQSANLVFLLMAVAVAVMTVSERVFRSIPPLRGIIATAFVVVNLCWFYGQFADLRSKYIAPENDFILRLSAFVKDHTAPDDVVMWQGFDWSSEEAFYSERKSLTLPGWTDVDLDSIRHTSKYLSAPPAAIVLCPNPRGNLQLQAIRESYPQASGLRLESCAIFFTGKPPVPASAASQPS